MSQGPQDATLNGDGFRFYRWEPAEGGEPTDVLSVTSIRKLCGEPFSLVNWQLANIADAALGTMKRTVIGPRGGIKDKRLIEEYPCEFAQKYDAAAGSQDKIDGLRQWLREQADEPRNIAAIRGTIVHEAIEKNIAWNAIERPYVESAAANLSKRDRDRMKKGVQEEDVFFVRNAVRQYWAMREAVPFVLLAREAQIFNLTAGYAGSADALAWFLPKGMTVLDVPPAGRVTMNEIARFGGRLAVLDWKTATDVYTDNVVQITAYGAGEFVGSGGVIDHRLTEILHNTTVGGIMHVRPNNWGVHLFEFNQEVVRAFLGSCVFARFLAKYPKPQPLFCEEIKGESEEVDE
jgi:hypothetical protein